MFIFWLVYLELDLIFFCKFNVDVIFSGWALCTDKVIWVLEHRYTTSTSLAFLVYTLFFISLMDGYWWCKTKDGKVFPILLTKQNKMKWYNCVLKGEPKINTWKVELENGKLSNLDLETQQTMEKKCGIDESSQKISSSC